MAEASSAGQKRKLSESSEGPSTSSDVSPSQHTTSSESTQTKKLKENYLKLCLTGEGYDALLSTEKSKRFPLLVADVTRLILNCQFGSLSPVKSRICLMDGTKAEKSVILYVDNCPPLDNITFPVHETLSCLDFELVSESRCSIDWTREMAFLTLMISDCEMLLKNYRSLKVARLQEEDVLGFLSMIYTINLNQSVESTLKHENDNFSRTHLLLTVPQMLQHNYPIPRRSGEYSLTHSQYTRPTPLSPLLSIDCEFVFTDQNKHELAEIAVVDENSESVYHTFVKPQNTIVNYLTEYSGITEETLQGVTTTLEDVQAKLKSILPSNSIVAGHSLDSDFRVLKILHPFIADSSLLYNDSGDSYKKTKLKTISKYYLNLDIQDNPQQGHSALEDATAAMLLIKHKLSRDFAYGNSTLEPSKKEQSKGFRKFIDKKGPTYIFGKEESVNKFRTNIASIALNKASEEINPNDDYSFSKVNCIVEENHEEVIKKMCESLPKADLLIGHLELLDNCQFSESVQGWEKEILAKVPEKTVVVFIFGNSEKRRSPRICRILV